MYTLGIQFSHHASVALLKDNEVIFFCLEERFDRKKRSGNFPSKALSQIKNFTNSIDKDKLIISPYTGINYNITKNYIYECARKYSI